MKLTELFPQLIKIKIQENEYPLKFGTRAVIQMEHDYPDEKERASLLKIQQVDKDAQPVVKVRSTEDLVNLLYAALLHTRAFPDKDSVIDTIEPPDYGDYINAIFAAFMQARATPEQLEKLQVMTELSDSKKNKQVGITQVSMPSTE